MRAVGLGPPLGPGVDQSRKTPTGSDSSDAGIRFIIFPARPRWLDMVS